MGSKKRVLVIGAGASGLVSIKACREEGFDVVCYEKAADIGGVWRYQDSCKDGEPSVMKSTVSNSSKEMSAFSDFPPPENFPLYLPHETMLKYFELYANQFSLHSSIKCLQKVIEVIPAETYSETGQWIVKVLDVETENEREELFDGIMVCSGHHTYPLMPPYPNLDLFLGKVLHSHDYKTFAGFEDKTVLVIGIGNSGTDIATELSSFAKKVYLSSRRGAWIYPRYVYKGKPVDITFGRRSFLMQPKWMVERSMRKMLTSAMDHDKFGIKPSHNVLSQHPTVNDDLKCKLASGTVILKKNVSRFAQSGALFEDERELTELDVVIFATGYAIKFPFQNADILRVDRNNNVFLYKEMFPPQLKHHTLGVIGLVQPNGALFPVFEMQARWFASLMAKRCRLPSNDKMLDDVRKTTEFRNKNFVQSSRHAIEINRILYMDNLACEIGVKPNLAVLMLKDPKLSLACLKGPCLPYQYRLCGPHKWSGARQAILSYKSRMYGFLKKGKNNSKPKV